MPTPSHPLPLDLHLVTTYQAGIVQSAAHRLIQKECDEYLQEFGITRMHWLIIGTIFEAGKDGVRISNLADTLQTTLPYLTNTLNTLEQKKIIERREDEKDNRAKTVFLSMQFSKRCPMIEEKLQQRLHHTLYRKISPEDFAIYLKVLFTLTGRPVIHS